MCGFVCVCLSGESLVSEWTLKRVRPLLSCERGMYWMRRSVSLGFTVVFFSFVDEL